MSTKATPVLSSFKSPRILRGEFENFITEDSYGLPQGYKIRKKVTVSPDVRIFLSNGKPKATTVHKDPFTHGRINSIIDNSPFLRRNDRRPFTLIKRWKSTQSSCKKDDCTRNSRRCIEEHRQSAETCERKSERCNDNYRTTVTKSRRSSCGGDVVGHQICQKSAGCPSHLGKPAQYTNSRACQSIKPCDPCDPQAKIEYSNNAKCLKSVSAKRWKPGKLATEGIVHRKCKPISCTNPDCDKQVICSPLRASTVCDKKNSGRIVSANSVCNKCPKRQHVEENCGMKTDTCTAEDVKPYPPSPTDYEHVIRADPPPPSCRHWTENLPPNCGGCAAKSTCIPIVESSPMSFIPYRRVPENPQKHTEGAENSQDVQDVPTGNGGSLFKRKDFREKRKGSVMPQLQLGKCGSCRTVTFEDKCGDSLTLPAPVSAVKPKLQQFPTLRKTGSCYMAKPDEKFVISDVSDCKPNVASLKHRLSKCPSIVEMSIAPDCKPSVCIDAPVNEGDASLLHCSETKNPKSPAQGISAWRKRRGIKSPSGWARQRYKIRLKVFQKGKGQLDPCLPPIVESKQSHDRRAESSPKQQLKSVPGCDCEPPPELKGSCPPEEVEPITEHKSYETKMEESRVKREKGSKDCPPKKYC